MSLSSKSAFSVRWAWQTQNDATPNFFPDPKTSILGFSNEVSFVSGLILEDHWIKQIMTENLVMPNLFLFSVVATSETSKACTWAIIAFATNEGSCRGYTVLFMNFSALIDQIRVQQ